MITITLNIIGLILIIYSISIIKKDLSNKEKTKDDLSLMEKRIKEYYNLTEEIVEEFDEIIDSKLEMIYKENDIINTNPSKIHNTNSEEDTPLTNNKVNNNNKDTNLFYNKVIELKRIGLTNEEIAKKLNKGIREVEIILKMYVNKK